MHLWQTAAACSPRLHHSNRSKFGDAEAVLIGNWPQLALIQVQPEGQYHCAGLYQHVHLPHVSNFQLIASISSAKDSKTDAAYLVSPIAECDEHKSVAAAFGHLYSPEWQKAANPTITIHTCGEVISQLTQIAWPCVTDLSLHHSRLCCSHMKQSAKGSWPKLERLNLDTNQLDEAAMTALSQGKWPLLTSLDLSISILSRLFMYASCRLEPWALLHFVVFA